MHADGHYHETLGYLHTQFGNLDQACVDYLNASEAFRCDNAPNPALHLTERLNELNYELEGHPPKETTPSLSVQLKVEILRLCRLGLRHSRQHQYQIALNVLERGLQVSEILVDVNQQQGHYCAAIVLGMMGKIYYTQRYYLFSLASFKAALDAYRSLPEPDKQTQSRIGTVLCKIADIAEITHHPDVAIEYYLDALWYLNASGQQPQAKQVIKHLNQLCDVPQPVHH